MKKILCLLILVLCFACTNKKKTETEMMISNLIERYGEPVKTETLGTGILWYKFVIDPSNANTKSVKGTIDKSLNMLPTEMKGDEFSWVSYNWETPVFLVHMENDYERKTNTDGTENSNIIIKIWVTNK